MYVCICAGVNDRQIKEAVHEGACSLDQLAACLGVGTGCGCCREVAQEILDQVQAVTIPIHAARELSRLAAPARPV